MTATAPKQPIGATVERPLEKLRVVRIVVLVTAPEKRMFKKMASERHTDLSELVRQLLHREADAQAERA